VSPVASRPRPFRQVDVFTAEPLRGNPLAVVLDGEGLSDARMLDFARWTRLSETTFLVPTTEDVADYRVRIFSPSGEMRFAGHPTLGSCHAWLGAGNLPKQADRVVQQCGVGLVPISLLGGRPAFAAPPLRIEPPAPALLAAVQAALGLSPSDVLASSVLDNGTGWLALRVARADTVLGLRPDHAALASLCEVGVIGAHDTGSDCLFEVRAFAAAIGILEDPVTGSLNASLAQWMIQDGTAPVRYTVAQGTVLGRAGRIHLHQDGNTCWVGGDSVTAISGEVIL